MGGELFLFAGPGDIDGRATSAVELAERMIRSGVVALALPAGPEPSAIAWPGCPRAAVFAHDSLDDAAVEALADALIQAGTDCVFVSGSRKRGPLTFRAVA